MEGLTFYFVSWCAWTITTFFLCKKNEYRLKATAIILLLLIISPYRITVLTYDIYLGIVLLLLVTFGYLVKKGNVSHISMFFHSFIICMTYASFHLFALYDPVWVLFSREWMVAIFIAFLAVFLHKNYFQRLMVTFLGVSQGEVLLSVTLKKLSIHYPIGAEAFLDVVALTVAILSIWKVFENAAVLFDQYGTIFEREKRKQL